MEGIRGGKALQSPATRWGIRGVALLSLSPHLVGVLLSVVGIIHAPAVAFYRVAGGAVGAALLVCLICRIGGGSFCRKCVIGGGVGDKGLQLLL